MTKSLNVGLLLALAIAASSRLLAADRVRLFQGSSSTGRLTKFTPEELTLESGSTEKTFPVNEVDVVTFDLEPTELAQGRAAARAGRYEQALAFLDRVSQQELRRPEMVQDYEFYKALAAAKLALAGSGSIAEAGRAMLVFEKSNKNSFHYFEACETLGDLLVALGKFDQAEAYYNKVAEAPWSEYKMRAGILVGRALVGQKRFDHAAQKFDEVLAMRASGKDADRAKLAASLGKASALGGAGKTDEAVKLIDEIIAKADPENQEIHARAYDVLGNCYRAAGKKKDAIIAFLHVDLLYSRFPEQHAEALANLATLFAEDGKAERAAAARATLKEKYPNSAWAAK